MCIINPTANRSNYRLLLGGYGRLLTHTSADWKRRVGKEGFLGNDMDRILNDNGFKKRQKILQEEEMVCAKTSEAWMKVCAMGIYILVRLEHEVQGGES